MTQLDDLKAKIRDVPDFPEPGIIFRDITPLLGDPQSFDRAVEALADYCRSRDAQAIAAIESRGFLFAAPVARELGLPLAPIRKAGKLPAETESMEFSLEYGTDKIEIHKDAFLPGQRVVLLDDLLATGGTAQAAAKLIEKVGGVVAGIGFLIELSALNGRELLAGRDVISFIVY